MRFVAGLTVACLLVLHAPALAHPQLVSDIQQRREPVQAVESVLAPVSNLWKRKGGGGGGGKGGGGSSSSGKGGNSGSGGTSSRYVPISVSARRCRYAFLLDARVCEGTRRRSLEVVLPSPMWRPTSSGIQRSKPAVGDAKITKPFASTSPVRRSLCGYSCGGMVLPCRGSSSSNAGGSTKTGSGVRPNYGGGRYYGGGATTPYTAGARSPLGIAPVFLGVGLLSIYPGLWLYGAYSYPYGNPYSFHNRTGRQNNTSIATRDVHVGALEIRQDDGGVNETKPVTCLCAAYSVCGCDDNNNSTFLDSIIGDGTYSALNHSLVTVADVNGTSTILLNGTLPNGTTAAGGTEDAETSGSSSESTSSSTSGAVRSAAGHLVMVLIVGLTCFAI
ncbi:hypothetical protein B2J93_4787 [Marssonina coronariae]|uniref:DUF7732 domain-containing protein n=1 Tax=Diplocarpon coronariae TaxID=2795749 RepID=A0A218Z4C1_9HELO|nr:hypothetical protein B2J93_4787 [Marssonina coronariae]